jgi:Tfp pilus assembly protein PilN
MTTEQEKIKTLLTKHNLDVKQKIKRVKEQKEYRAHLKLLGIPHIR